MTKFLPHISAFALLLAWQPALAGRPPGHKDEAASKIAELSSRVQVLEEGRSQHHRLLEQQMSDLGNLKARQDLLSQKNRELVAHAASDEEHVRQMRLDAEGASHRSEIAAVLMILGMVLEIVGGTLLAGAHLSAKQARLAGLRVGRPLQDLALRDTRYEPILTFLGLLGSIAIVLGFGLQLAGTLVTSSLPMSMRVAAAAVAVTLSFALFWFFLGQTPDQTRGEKIGIIVHNVKRNILLPALRVLLRRDVLECEVCLEAVSPNELEVWWLAQENSEKFPYLNQPYDFHYGHDHCLPFVDDFVEHDNRANNRAVETRAKLFKQKADDFVKATVPKLEDWYKEFHAHWTQRRGIPSEKTAMEEQLEIVSQRAKKHLRAGRVV